MSAVSPSRPSQILALAWNARPTSDFGLLGGLPVTAASWCLAAKHRIDVPQLDANLICIALSGARRHALWLDGHDAGSGYAPPGSTRIVPAGARAEVEVEGLASDEGHFGFFHLYAPAEAFAELGLATPAGLVRPGAGEPDMWLETIARRLTHLSAGTPASRLEQGYLTLAALAHIAARYGDDAQAPRAALAKGGLAPWQVKRVTDYVEADLTRQHTVTELAALCALSPFHFARAFHKSVGRPPHAYVTSRRVGAAERMLRSTTVPVTEIALAVGFKEASHLARAFRRAVGRSPSEYRRLVLA